MSPDEKEAATEGSKDNTTTDGILIPTKGCSMNLSLWKVALAVQILGLLILGATQSHAEEISVFDMRKNLALSDDEKVFKDFFLSKGAGSGLRPGMILTVKRKIPFYDTIHNRTAGDLNIAVGRVRVIHVERDMAVARQYSEFSREDMPLLEDNYIMIGDEVDLSSATTENKLKGKSAEQAPPSAPATAPTGATESAPAENGPVATLNSGAS